MTSPAIVTAHEAKTSKILAAAREAFLAFGYAETSMDMVAQRAQASKTTLYARFPSKAELFSATLQAECHLRGVHFDPADFQDKPPREVLFAIGQRFVELMWSPDTTRIEQIVIGEAGRFPEVAEVFLTSAAGPVCAAVTEYFATASAHGLLRIADPEFASDYFLAALKGMRHMRLLLGHRSMPSAEERSAFVVQTVDMFLAGVGA
jgi:TetR/AcrR family transcriptional regulator, mexJK operon transcriptional repressor